MNLVEGAENADVFAAAPTSAGCRSKFAFTMRTPNRAFRMLPVASQCLRLEPSMIRSRYSLIIIAATAALVACGDKPSPPPKTTVSPPVSSAPSTPAITTPAIPAPPPTATGTTPTETAKDSAATNPKATMSTEQESKSMPMSGQAGSHSSTALDSKETPKK
jgi:hypothetical protein